jgi:hypothetical protein
MDVSGATRKNTIHCKPRPSYNMGMKDGDTAGVLERLLEPLSRCLNADSARALVELRADPVAEARIEELAEKCNEGQLTPDEHREYETYVHVGNVIAILQAKARLQLKRPASS